jgi:multisubunit Na+/H+ antiporter MnhC subunit
VSVERHPPEAGRSSKAGLKASDVVPYVVTSGVGITGMAIMSAGLFGHFGDPLNLALVIAGAVLGFFGMMACALCSLLRR